jgi:hypothetical protein|tara:strand:+ start:553 stop:672 length:120 start_codon:yes stop_codon:yes gene_type:complete
MRASPTELYILEKTKDALLGIQAELKLVNLKLTKLEAKL